jgi:hypothetical protein
MGLALGIDQSCVGGPIQTAWASSVDKSKDAAFVAGPASVKVTPGGPRHARDL